MGRKRTDGKWTSFKNERPAMRILQSALVLLALASTLTTPALAEKSIDKAVNKARKYFERGEVRYRVESNETKRFLVSSGIRIRAQTPTVFDGQSARFRPPFEHPDALQVLNGTAVEL